MAADYKTVFQLAQDKGMKKPLVFIDNELYITALIQKWLRDEHKIAVLIGRFAAGFYNYSIVPDINKSGENQVIKRSSFSKCWREYESALLEGINEGLKLI